MTLAQLILESLEHKEMTKVDLANALELDTPNSVSKWTSTVRRDPVPWRHWRRICAVLDIPWTQWYRIAKREFPHSARAYERFVSSMRRSG